MHNNVIIYNLYYTIQTYKIFHSYTFILKAQSNTFGLHKEVLNLRSQILNLMNNYLRSLNINC